MHQDTDPLGSPLRTLETLGAGPPCQHVQVALVEMHVAHEQAEDFALAVLERRPPLANPAASLKNLAMILAAYRSLQSGRPEQPDQLLAEAGLAERVSGSRSQVSGTNS